MHSTNLPLEAQVFMVCIHTSAGMDARWIFNSWCAKRESDFELRSRLYCAFRGAAQSAAACRQGAISDLST
ncbi:MAG: hypothetical protein JWQ49_5399 [Edaphobacter sp.]|nr:hypothetical protein [Edaphobacter sp.]